MEISIDDAIVRSDLVFIDVRSPAEYAGASIPGALNIPLFNNREHRELGIIYHQLGEKEARRRALEIVAPKLPDLVNSILESCGKKTPLLYCYRGGLRSLSMYQILNLTGLPCLRLKHGYKGYRNYINKKLETYELDKKIFILHGLTGVGKTTLISRLRNKGYATIDIEDLAKHRGSVFGTVGINEFRSQKDFDALLLQQLDLYSDSPYLIIEGEGRRIGDIYIPKFLFRAMEAGCHILVTASLETRVKRIVDTYISSSVAPELIEELKRSLSLLSRRLGKRRVDSLLALLDQREYYAVAEILCTDYYDTFYSDSRPEHSTFSYTVDAENLDNATRELMKIVDSAG